MYVNNEGSDEPTGMRILARTQSVLAEEEPQTETRYLGLVDG